MESRGYTPPSYTITTDVVYLQRGDDSSMNFGDDSAECAAKGTFSNEAFTICLMIFLLFIGCGLGLCASKLLMTKQKDEKLATEIVRKMSQELDRRESADELEKDRTIARGS